VPGAGDGTAELAGRPSVSPASVRRARQRHRRTGVVGPRAGRPARPPEFAARPPRTRVLPAAAPDPTLSELRDELTVAVALPTLCAAVRSLAGVSATSSD
jgi:hypothetical protein